MKRWKAIAFYAIICAILCSSCKTAQTPLLDSDYYLDKNTIAFSSGHRVDDKENLRYAISSLIEQDENTSRLWPPKKWFSKDTLVVFDNQLAERSAASIEKFLRNKKGYYQAKVKHNVGIEGKQISSNYLIDVGTRYRVNSFELTSSDKAILEEIKNLKSVPLLKVGDPVDASLFESERIRITSDLQNLGYANFVPNFIQIIGDSSDYAVDVEFNIIVPPSDSNHKKYYVGDINVYTEHLVGPDPIFSKVEAFQTGTFFSRSNDFIVKPKYLAKNIYLRPGDLYKKQERIKTQQTLNSLSTYKYAQVNRKLNPERDSIYDFDIYLSPYKHRWISDQGAELFYSFGATSIQQNLFGLSAFGSLQNRNLFGGSERYTFSLDGSVELAIPSFAANRWSFGANNSLEIPRLLDLFGIAKSLGKVNLIPSDNYNPFEDEANTEVALGYNFTRSIRNFSISSFNASWGYDYRANNELLRKIRQLGLNLFIFNPTDQFIENNLQGNELLANSFENNLSTGFILRDLGYFYSGAKNSKGRSLGLILNLEQSGLEVFAANKLGNLISGNSDDVWKFGSFNFAKYIKLGVDGRYYQDLSQSGSSQLAARVDLGIAVPFGRQDDGELLATPYLSQFYVGGPNSLRGWQIRELGPGSFSSILEPPFFQAGDIKMEFNLEYRWDLFLFFKGALFVDAGNIWTIRQETGDGARAGSQFTSNFLDQMAVSSGWGIRADFTYFLIRVDFGYKIRSPFELDESGSHFVFGKKIPGTDESFNNLLGNINVAINYPF